MTTRRDHGSTLPSGQGNTIIAIIISVILAVVALGCLSYCWYTRRVSLGVMIGQAHTRMALSRPARRNVEAGHEYVDVYLPRYTTSGWLRLKQKRPLSVIEEPSRVWLHRVPVDEDRYRVVRRVIPPEGQQTKKQKKAQQQQQNKKQGKQKPSNYQQNQQQNQSGKKNQKGKKKNQKDNQNEQKNNNKVVEYLNLQNQHQESWSNHNNGRGSNEQHDSVPGAYPDNQDNQNEHNVNPWQGSNQGKSKTGWSEAGGDRWNA